MAFKGRYRNLRNNRIVDEAPKCSISGDVSDVRDVMSNSVGVSTFAGLLHLISKQSSGIYIIRFACDVSKNLIYGIHILPFI